VLWAEVRRVGGRDPTPSPNPPHLYVCMLLSGMRLWGSTVRRGEGVELFVYVCSLLKYQIWSYVCLHVSFICKPFKVMSYIYELFLMC
jgi:tryptophan-rich sensory protein